MREVALQRSDAATAEQDRAAGLALASWLERERGRSAGALQLGLLAGDAVALGRDQAGPPGALRRLSGGHAVRCGSGVLSLRLVLPTPAAWLEEPLPRLDRLLNRYVRGLLAALRSLGFDASYPGRDVVRAGGRAVAYLGCERDERGVCLFEALVGVSAPLAPDRLDALPGGARSPLAGAAPLFPPDAADAAGRLADAILAAYGRRHGLHFAPGPVPAGNGGARGGAPAAAIDAPLGPARAIPIGTLRAGVRLGARGELAAVRFASEWIADSAGVAALAGALVGAPLERAALKARAAPVLADPAHCFLGLDGAESVVEAVLGAAEAARR